MNWAAIGAAAGGALTEMLSPLWQTISDNRNYRYSKEMADYQNQMALQWWNMQNEYNTPKNQISRMVDAGLNPNLAYGQLSSSNAGDIGTPAVPNKPYSVDYRQALVGAVNQAIDLVDRRLDLKKKSDDLSIGGFGFGDDTLPFGDVNVRSYRDYVNALAKARLFGAYYNAAISPQNLESRILENENKSTFNRYLDDFLFWRNAKQIRQTDLLDREIDMKGFRIDLQKQINDWYEINQWSNLIDKGINSILRTVDVFSPKKLLKIIKKM